MIYEDERIAKIRHKLLDDFETLADKKQLLRAPELKALYSEIPSLAPEQRAKFGQEINKLKAELENIVENHQDLRSESEFIDITAPFDINTPVDKRPRLLTADHGTIHPLTIEMRKISDIFIRMGFNVEESRQIDDDFHMFESLNFPADHPAKDDYDTFMTTDGFIAPAHTSTMQNRVLKKYRPRLESDEAIAVVIPDRVFRNEDLDATHEHTFYQIEGVYVDREINVGNLIAVLKAYMSEYFGQELNVRIQPFYFPFTEPSFEFAVERPDVLRKDSTEAEQWLELGGCGMIHPNVLKMADIDPIEYSGFAWGFGIERMVMLKNGIEDIRHFESAKLSFLRQFK
ncbi:MAG: phenylalanine--tRNA ligase subunit alpha [Candidatus Saccharimonadales bacterium]